MIMRKVSRDVMNPLDREFIRILTDFGFKRVFGSSEHKGLLLRFLNALFEGEKRITNLEFRDKEIIPFHSAGKKVVYDIYCTTETGEHFILEMQQEESENFSIRIMFYGVSAVVKQGMRGVEYDIDPVVCIVFTDFNLSGMSRTLLKDILLIDRHTGEVYTDRLRYIFISLPEIPEEWDDCRTEFQRITYLIKNMENMTRESKPYRTGDYDDFFAAASTTQLTNEEAVAYSQSYLKEIENQSAVRFAASRSRAEGEAKGREEERRRIIEAARKSGLSEEMIASIIGI